MPMMFLRSGVAGLVRCFGRTARGHEPSFEGAAVRRASWRSGDLVDRASRSNNLAVTADVSHLAAMGAMLSSPSSEVAAATNRAGPRGDLDKRAARSGRRSRAALTSHAVRDGFDSGSEFGYLQSSAIGHDVFRRLGFRDVEEYTLLTRPPQS
jgi:hypothetical protein